MILELKTINFPNINNKSKRYAKIILKKYWKIVVTKLDYSRSSIHNIKESLIINES